MAQLLKGETFTDVSPGKTVTSGRLNSHVDAAILLKGAVNEQPELTDPTDLNDFTLISDETDAVTSTPKKTTLKNLLPETIRQGVPQYVATDSGGANAYVVALDPAATAYTAGMVVRFKASNANTGASTINVNALGVKNIIGRDGNALAVNDILAAQVCVLVYDGTAFQLISAISASEITATHLIEAARRNIHQYVADSGAANAYVATLSPAATAYTAGMVVRFKATNANTGASTINVNGLGVKSIVKNNGTSALVANDIVAGQLVALVYDGTSFQIGQIRSWDFTNTGAVPANSAALTIAHGLGVRPTRVYVVLLQNTAAAQQSYAQNDEVEINGTQNSSNGNRCFTVSADATNITIAKVNVGTTQVVPKIGGAPATITEANWLIKVYASI